MWRTIVAVLAFLLLASPAPARPLAQVKEIGAIALCAHPNALPYSAKAGDKRGFQIETAAALAKSLGVELQVNWVTTPMDVNRTDCDIMMDAIDDPDALNERRLTLSHPYRRGSVVLAVPATDRTIKGLRDLADSAKVGVLPASLAAFVLQERHVHTSPDVFEDGLLDGVASGEYTAAAVSRIAFDWYNATHRVRPMRIVDAFAGMPDFEWNVAVGVVKPDTALLSAINAALDRLIAAGTVRTIYARYGIALAPSRTEN